MPIHKKLRLGNYSAISKKKLYQHLLFTGLGNLVTSKLKILVGISTCCIFVAFLYATLTYQMPPIFIQKINSMCLTVAFLLLPILIIYSAVIKHLERQLTHLSLLLYIYVFIAAVSKFNAAQCLKLFTFFLFLWSLLIVLNEFFYCQILKQWHFVAIDDFERYWQLVNYTKTEKLESGRVKLLVSSEKWSFKYGGTFFIEEKLLQGRHCK